MFGFRTRICQCAYAYCRFGSNGPHWIFVTVEKFPSTVMLHCICIQAWIRSGPMHAYVCHESAHSSGLQRYAIFQIFKRKRNVCIKTRAEAASCNLQHPNLWKNPRTGQNRKYHACITVVQRCVSNIFTLSQKLAFLESWNSGKAADPWFGRRNVSFQVW